MSDTPDFAAGKCGCGGTLRHIGHTTETLVGFQSPPGHNHNDNCLNRDYACESCLKVYKLSKRRTCSTKGCDWKGKTSCFCHTGDKLDEWPSNE